MDDAKRKAFEKPINTYIEIIAYLSTKDGTESKAITITDKQIVSGSLKIDRYCASTDSIEIGNTSAAELDVELYNTHGEFNDYNFEGADLQVIMYAKREGGEPYSIKMGTYTVEDAPRKLSTITISALDRMRHFDQLAVNVIADNMSLESLVALCCDRCGISHYGDISGRTNHDYQIPYAVNDVINDEDNEITYRTLIGDCAAIMGCNAYMDGDDTLQFGWFGDDALDSLDITAANRFDGADIYEKPIKITGVYYDNGESDEDAFVYGDDEANTYPFDLSDNDLLVARVNTDGETTYDRVETALKNLDVALANFEYTGFSCETPNDPWLMPMSTIYYTDKDGNVVKTYATNVTVNYKGHTELKAVYKTEEQSKYYTPSKLKSQAALERKVDEKIGQIEEKVSSQVQATYDMNEMLANSMGLNVKVVTDEDGRQTYYFYNGIIQEDGTVEGCNVVYMFNEDGFHWQAKGDNDSDEWFSEDGWQYGLDANGNAILNYLYVNQLNAKQILVESIITSGEFVYTNTDTGVNFSITSEGVSIHTDTLTLETTGYFETTAGKIGALYIYENKLTSVGGGLNIYDDGLVSMQEAYIKTLYADYIYPYSERNIESEPNVGLIFASKDTEAQEVNHISIWNYSWDNGLNTETKLSVHITTTYELEEDVEIEILVSDVHAASYTLKAGGQQWVLGFDNESGIVATSTNISVVPNVIYKTVETPEKILSRGNLLPEVTRTYSLGDDELIWDNIRTDKIETNNINIDEWTIPSEDYDYSTDRCVPIMEIYDGSLLNQRIKVCTTQGSSPSNGRNVNDTIDCITDLSAFRIGNLICYTFSLDYRFDGDTMLCVYFSTDGPWVWRGVNTVFKRVISVQATTRLTYNGSLSGYTHRGHFSTCINGKYVYIANDYETAAEGCDVIMWIEGASE